MSAPFSPDNRPKVGQQYKHVASGTIKTVEHVGSSMCKMSCKYTYDIVDFGTLQILLIDGTLIRI